MLIATLEAYFQGDLPQIRWIADQNKPAQPTPVAPKQLFANTSVQEMAPLHPQWYRRGINVGMEPRDPTLNRIRFEDVSDPALHLTDLIDYLGQHYGQPPVVLIGEYDAPITRLIGTDGTDIPAAPILGTLRDFYGVLKASEDSLRFVFITGISRFVQVNLFLLSTTYRILP